MLVSPCVPRGAADTPSGNTYVLEYSGDLQVREELNLEAVVNFLSAAQRSNT